MSQGQLDARLATVESRVASLETLSTVANPKLDRVEDKFFTLTERVAKLEERVSHLPSKDFIVKAVITTITIVTGVIGFLPKIQQLFSAVPKP
ncbi:MULTISPECIES: hypothetical protein [unclassified Bradyrhizobium]